MFQSKDLLVSPTTKVGHKHNALLHVHIGIQVPLGSNASMISVVIKVFAISKAVTPISSIFEL